MCDVLSGLFALQDSVLHDSDENPLVRTLEVSSIIGSLVSFLPLVR